MRWWGQAPAKYTQNNVQINEKGKNQTDYEVKTTTNRIEEDTHFDSYLYYEEIISGKR